MSHRERVLYDLVHFQIAAEAYPEKSAQCFALFFDVEKLTWETDFTWRNFIEGYLHLSPPAGLKDELDAMWIKITGELAANMEALAHRDFHSRNIMVTGGRLVWIDYQDARMGRRLYDLASLLYDPYVALSPVAIDDLAEYYFSRVDGAGAATWNRDEFDRLLNLSALQRIYKALGTYGYQTSARGVDTYVPYIAPSIATLRRIASKTNDTAPLVSLLELIRP